MNDNQTIVTPTKTKNKFWDYFGKFAALIALTWGSIQIMNFLFKKEYKANISGFHSEILLPTSNKLVLPDIDKYEKEIIEDSIFKMVIINREKTKASDFRNVNELSKYYEATRRNYSITTDNIYNFVIPKVIALNTTAINLNISELPKYSSLWTININNFGDKPLEDLFLELPFDGVYETTNSSDKTTVSGSYMKRINLSTLRPKYQISVKAWRINPFPDYPVYIDYYNDEKESRITHKYGSFAIEYPIADTRFYNFCKKHDLLVFYSIMFIFSIGILWGSRIGARDKEKEMNKLKITPKPPLQNDNQKNEDENNKA
jgi:hypothetical protein